MPQPIGFRSLTSERSPWLFSRHADFWLASGGASLALLACLPVILWYGNRELDALDFVLSEFHLGATYDAILRRRLWRQQPFDVLLIPLCILALTYALSVNGHTTLLTSIAMYAAVWHRGRQSLGVARFYQRQIGGPVSRAHNALFRGAIYLPMLAATFAYTHLAPMEYDGKTYYALSLGLELTATMALAAALWVAFYFIWTLRCNSALPLCNAAQNLTGAVHPGEGWVVLAHAIAFGSGYFLGASNASFVLVLAVHHEVQYLYFAYAVARRSAAFDGNESDIQSARRPLASRNASRGTGTEIKFAASFMLLPVIGFVAAVLGAWLELEWLIPLGVGGLLCHYWLDGRIWKCRPTA
jgi:hypothetical protein